MRDDYQMRIGEAAKYLGVCTMTLRRWDRDGKLIAIRRNTKKKSSNRRFYKEDLDKLIDMGLI